MKTENNDKINFLDTTITRKNLKIPRYEFTENLY